MLSQNTKLNKTECTLGLQSPLPSAGPWVQAQAAIAASSSSWNEAEQTCESAFSVIHICLLLEGQQYGPLGTGFRRQLGSSELRA